MARSRRGARAEKNRAIIPLTVPTWYEEESGDVTDGFRKAFEHAAQHGNTEKSALLFAESHQDDADFNPQVKESEEEEAERLKTRLAELEGDGATKK